MSSYILVSSFSTGGLDSLMYLCRNFEIQEEKSVEFTEFKG